MGTPILFVHGPSVNPEIASLSPTTFALSYYHQVNQNITLVTNYGVVNSGLQITLGTSLTYHLSFIYSLNALFFSLSSKLDI